jgi:uroporphyrinogen-III decarboxylase
MTSRQRVAAALNHREPDRVPIDLGSSVVTGIMATTYARLREKLGLDGPPPRICDLLQMLAEVEPPAMEALGCDIVGLLPLVRSFGIANRDYKPWRTFDGTEVLVPGEFNYRTDESGDLLLSPGGDVTKTPSGRMPKDGYYFDIIVRQQPLNWDRLDPREFAEQFTRLSDEELSHLQTTAQQLYANTDYALLGGFGGGGLGDLPKVLAPEVEAPKGIRNFDDWMVAHLTHPRYIREIFHLQTEQAIENLDLYHQAVGTRIAAVLISGTDFGTQRGEFISPALYRSLYLPFHKRMNDWVHEHTTWKTFYHCCGSVYHLLPLFIEAGVDILNPVQCSAAEMDPARLKREFGHRIVFWGGGVDTQKTLPFGTPEEVRAEVTDRLRTLAPGGGYVFGSIHNIQASTPPENIVAMFDAARTVGQYPVA